jgi:flavin reductase (DIM6/NTAB) family NADH-FMN oxidoreductase RutF
MSATPVAFRQMMARWPTGVSVVTARDGDHDVGLTVNAFLSVSLDPPTVLVSLGLDADSTPVIERTQRFAVNVLAASQRSVSERFAQTIPSEKKFAGNPIHRGPDGLARLNGTLATFICRVRVIHAAGDHRLVLGEVEDLEAGTDAPPLLFYHGGYGETDAQGRVTLPSARH